MKWEAPVWWPMSHVVGVFVIWAWQRGFRLRRWFASSALSLWCVCMFVFCAFLPILLFFSPLFSLCLSFLSYWQSRVCGEKTVFTSLHKTFSFRHLLLVHHSTNRKTISLFFTHVHREAKTSVQSKNLNKYEERDTQTQSSCLVKAFLVFSNLDWSTLLRKGQKSRLRVLFWHLCVFFGFQDRDYKEWKSRSCSIWSPERVTQLNWNKSTKLNMWVFRDNGMIFSDISMIEHTWNYQRRHQQNLCWKEWKEHLNLNLRKRRSAENNCMMIVVGLDVKIFCNKRHSEKDEGGSDWSEWETECRGWSCKWRKETEETEHHWMNRTEFDWSEWKAGPTAQLGQPGRWLVWFSGAWKPRKVSQFRPSMEVLFCGSHFIRIRSLSVQVGVLLCRNLLKSKLAFIQSIPQNHISISAVSCYKLNSKFA